MCDVYNSATYYIGWTDEMFYDYWIDKLTVVADVMFILFILTLIVNFFRTKKGGCTSNNKDTDK